jgi:hypothetical protein
VTHGRSWGPDSVSHTPGGRAQRRCPANLYADLSRHSAALPGTTAVRTPPRKLTFADRHTFVSRGIAARPPGGQPADRETSPGSVDAEAPAPFRSGAGSLGREGRVSPARPLNRR